MVGKKEFGSGPRVHPKSRTSQSTTNRRPDHRSSSSRMPPARDRVADEALARVPDPISAAAADRVRPISTVPAAGVPARLFFHPSAVSRPAIALATFDHADEGHEPRGRGPGSGTPEADSA